MSSKSWKGLFMAAVMNLQENGIHFAYDLEKQTFEMVPLMSNKTAAPHRATREVRIKMCPCGHCGKSVIEVDGVALFDGGSRWRGTEAEAKAKLESLSHDI